jgi:hypothetical protein
MEFKIISLTNTGLDLINWKKIGNSWMPKGRKEDFLAKLKPI